MENLRPKGPKSTFVLGGVLLIAGVVAWAIGRFWWALMIAGGLLIAAAALGWLALNMNSRKDLDRHLRRLRLKVVESTT